MCELFTSTIAKSYFLRVSTNNKNTHREGRDWPWRTGRGWCGGRCCVPCFCHKKGGTASRSAWAAAAAARWVADITHTLWVEDHPGRGRRRGRIAWSGQENIEWWRKKKRVKSGGLKAEGVADVQQRAVAWLEQTDVSIKCLDRAVHFCHVMNIYLISC